MPTLSKARALCLVFLWAFEVGEEWVRCTVTSEDRPRALVETAEILASVKVGACTDTSKCIQVILGKRSWRKGFLMMWFQLHCIFLVKLGGFLESSCLLLCIEIRLSLPLRHTLPRGRQPLFSQGTSVVVKAQDSPCLLCLIIPESLPALCNYLRRPLSISRVQAGRCSYSSLKPPWGKSELCREDTRYFL